MTTPPPDDNLYAPPSASIVDRQPPTAMSRLSRVCVRSAVAIASLSLASTYLVRDVPSLRSSWLIVLASIALPTGWLFWTRKRLADDFGRLTPKRLLWLSIAFSACTLALATLLVFLGNLGLLIATTAAGVPL